MLKASVWEKRVKQKEADPKVRVIATPPPWFDYNWTVPGDLDPALIGSIATVPVTVDVSVIEIPTLGEWGLALLALLLAGAATLRVARRERRS